MKHRLLQFLVLNSLVYCMAVTAGAQRPRYGGTLRIEIQAAVSSLENPNISGPADENGARNLASLIYDRLVTLDLRGDPHPALAVSWDHNKENTEWRFRLRAGVKWHDGSSMTADEVLASLQDSPLASHFQVLGDKLVASFTEPHADLPIYLATDATALIRNRNVPAATTPLQGSGPFRVLEWHPGTRAVLQANEDYWGGRPYLDNVDVVMGHPSRDQMIDLELDRADLVQLDPLEGRRLQQEQKQIWISSPTDLISLQFDIEKTKVQDPRLREAIALAINRDAINKFILQNYGESTASIFPEWLSGYSFLFPIEPNLERARKRLAEIPKQGAFKLGYDSGDSLLRQIAERIAVNVRDAGLILEPTELQRNGKPSYDPEVRVLRTHVQGPTMLEAIAQLGESAILSSPTEDPERIYAAEQAFLSDYVHVPLTYVPELIGIGGHLKGWEAAPWGDWHLENVWLEVGKP